MKAKNSKRHRLSASEVESTLSQAIDRFFRECRGDDVSKKSFDEKYKAIFESDLDTISAFSMFLIYHLGLFLFHPDKVVVESRNRNQKSLH